MALDTEASASECLDDYARLRLHLEEMRERALEAVPWGPDTVGIPAQSTPNALARINNVAFYANAREEITRLVDLCLNVLALHHPRGNGRPDTPAWASHRCHSCALRWPCPTIRELTAILDRPTDAVSSRRPEPPDR